MNRQKIKSQSGFSLLETLLAVAILATAIMLLANSWSSSFLRVRKTQRQFEIAALLEKKIAEVEVEYRGKSLDEIPDEKGPESFGDEYPQYKWKVTSKKLELPDLSATMAAQDGGANQFMMMVVKQLSEGISKSVKEVTVSIILEEPNFKKPLEYGVTTYFIDYDKEIQMGVPTGK